MAFRDRTEAGALLAAHLSQYRDDANVVVLGLPRGGVPVAYEVAKALHAPLDVFIVRKLGLPGQEELAMGAIATGGVIVLNDEVVRGLDVSQQVLDSAIASEQRELDRREHEYRDGRPALSVEGRTVIIVDDGLATGSTMRAAVRALRRLKPARIVVAVPVGARSTCTQLRSDADEVVCAEAPEHFYAVGLWYHDFSQTTDQEVKQLLADAAQWDFSHASS
jgi:putative phosphoribosyl transferase